MRFNSIKTAINNKKFKLALIIILTVLFSSGCIAGLAYGRYQTFNTLYPNYTNAKNYSLCNTLIQLPSPLSQVKLISTFISTFIIAILIAASVLRREKLFYYFKIENQFKKCRRKYIAFVYGIIAYQIINVTFYRATVKESLFDFSDPTGLSLLIAQLIDVVLIGFRYFPILIAFKLRKPYLNLLTIVYLWIDIALELFYEAVCDTVTFRIISLTFTSLKSAQTFYTVFICLFELPNIIFANFISLKLVFDVLKKYSIRPKTESSSEFNILLNLAKNHDLFYSPADLRYCKCLLKKMKISSTLAPEKNNEKLINRVERWINEIFKNYIYDSALNFRYTLRFLSTQTVCILIVYLISLSLVTINVNFTEKALFNDVPANVANRSALIFCKISFVVCSSEGKLFYLLDPQQEIDIIGAIWALITIPLVLSVLICMLQIVYGINNYKRDYLFLSKGKNPFISNRSLVDNQQIGVCLFTVLSSGVIFVIFHLSRSNPKTPIIKIRHAKI